ncbi:Metallo-hydrolase/oxidoreductase [Atractiella rhizophila]|nr:Metallo-hydrolase/oxidoreductase [Atractiella rhizophila]
MPSTSSPITFPGIANTVSLTPISAPSPADLLEKKHHNKDGKGFHNPWPSWNPLPFRQMLGTILARRTARGKQPSTKPPHYTVVKPTFLNERFLPSSSSLRATWMGHAAYFLEFPSSLRVIFDPVFTDRCSPSSFMGPKRYTPLPAKTADIPIIDLVIISHSHYDHLSHPTVVEIAKKFPDCQFLVPLGNKAWFQSCGIKNVTEMDWWETNEIKIEVSKGTHGDGGVIEATVACLPAQHTSGRTGFDRDHTLWASWSVESGGKKVWFGGDTGYRATCDIPEGSFVYDPKYDHLPVCPVFKEIGNLRGPFDLGLIPIGAYDPRFLFSSMHADPYDAVNIFLDTKCEKAMGIHYATWVLTEEEITEPPKLLKEALKWKEVPEEKFGTCDIGGTRDF